MANEINASCSLTVSKNDITANGRANMFASLVGNNFTSLVQTISTSAALVQVGGLTTFGGFHLIKNMDAALNVNLYQDGATCSVLIGTLLPGEAMLLKPAAALGVKSVSGTPDISVVCSEP